jgi:hypothetical protein
MNSKTAKRLRREANHHPNNQSKYEWAGPKKSTLELAPDCSRFLYGELKKEYKNGQNSNR